MKNLLTILLLCLVLLTNTSFKKPFLGKDDIYIVITKTKYELSIYDGNDNWIITYPVVFGNSDMGDKMVEGDRKTPEGIFHIVAKRPHPKWEKFLKLDYPTEDSYKRFYERKASGLLPANARIGGEIGIHGTWPHEDYAVDQYQNWTLGCISTKNEYILDMFKTVPIGTKVIINH